MTYQPKILAFAGSLRKDSLNKKLVKIAAKGAEEAGAQVTVIDLADYPLPLYDGDIEAAGFPENALKLKKLFWENDGLIISSPEYNSSISGVLKNVIDWVSRMASKDETNLSCFKDKVALIISISPGGLGGLRGLVILRSLLENINTIVLPSQKTVPNGFDAFDEQGQLKNSELAKSIKDMAKSLSTTLIKLKG